MRTFKVGDKVVLARDVERFPSFIAKAGMTGTISRVEDNGDLAARMDETIAGCEEWNNEIHWWEEFTADIRGDLAPA
jgi:superfamily I DNA and RNA helicase